MNDIYDDPSNLELRTKLFREGKVVFLLPKKQASLLRSLSQTDIKLGMITRRNGWKNRIHARYLMVVGIINVLLLSVRSQKTSDAFAFFAINKGDTQKWGQVLKYKSHNDTLPAWPAPSASNILVPFTM